MLSDARSSTGERAKGALAWTEGEWSSDRRRLVVGGLALAAVAFTAVAVYLVLHRPDDISRGAEADFDAGEQSVAKADDWPLYGLDDARTRYFPSREVRPPFRVRWSFNARSLLEYSPVIVDGAIYGVSNDGEAFALSQDTGVPLWRRQVSRLNASSPTYADGRLFTVSLEPGSALALDPTSGRTLWKRSLPGRSESSPIATEGLVIFGCENGEVFALDQRTGRTVWKSQVGGAVKAAPALSKGILYVAAYGGVLKALEASDGDEVWSANSQSGGLAGAGNFYATPTVAFGRVFVGNTDGRMYSFVRRSGELAWSRSTGSYVYAAAVAADTPKTRPSVYFGSYDGRFYALDARTGSVRWSRPAGGAVSGAASLIGNTLYVANLRWTSTAGFDASSGRRKFAFPDGAYNPAITDGNWLILTGKKKIYGLEPVRRLPSGSG